MNTPTEAGYYWAKFPETEDYFEHWSPCELHGSGVVFNFNWGGANPIEWGERIDREEMEKKTETMNKMLADMKEMRQEINRLKKQLEQSQPLDTVP